MTTARGPQGAKLPVSVGDGSCLKGAAVTGEQDDACRRDLDNRLLLLIGEGERFSVNGWCHTIEAGVSA